MNLIGRYIFRETLGSTVVVMAVLLLIFMSNQFAETLGDAAADALPREAVFHVFGLQFLRFLALLAPVGLLLGVLLALARLNRDSEMSALAACGVGPGRLLGPVGLLAILVASGVGWLALVESPQANLAIEKIRFDAREDFEFGTPTEGGFTELSGGATVLYAGEIEDNLWRDVFIQNETEDGVVVVVAAEAERVPGDTGNRMTLILRNGTRYDGTPGEAAFLLESFGEHYIPIELDAEVFEPSIESVSTATLLDSTEPAARAELQWRIAAPASVLILALLAVPLGRSSPREGKYARVGLGLLIYIVYANTLSMALIWVERDVVPQALGSWWVHLAPLALGGLMLARQSGLGAGSGRPVTERHEPAD